MSRLIFIDPSVLGAFISSVPTSANPFDSNACEAFRDLMKRVDDAAIIILARPGNRPQLERLKEIWEHEGLFGNRIVDMIHDRYSSLFPVYSVHNYIRKFHPEIRRFYPDFNPDFGCDSFVIVDRMRYSDTYPDRLVNIAGHLTSDSVENIVEVLNRRFNSWDICREYHDAGQRANECTCHKS